MDNDELVKLSTHQKALKINLDPMFYGAFAEIGAGQEVARWFFKVGAAAGTISKSTSSSYTVVTETLYCRRKLFAFLVPLSSTFPSETHPKPGSPHPTPHD